MGPSLGPHEEDHHPHGAVAMHGTSVTPDQSVSVANGADVAAACNNFTHCNLDIGI